MSEPGPCSPEHGPVVLRGYLLHLLHLLHGPIWGALGAQGRRAPGRDREGTAESSLGACWPSGKSWKGQALEVLTSMWTGMWARHRARGGGRVLR